MSMAQRVRERKRNSREVMRETIVELCTVRALTAPELAELLGVSKEYLRNEYLSPMISDGLLHHHKDAPTDPNQRYVTP